MPGTVLRASQTLICFILVIGSVHGMVVKNLPASAGDPRDMGLIPGSGRFPGVGNGNLLQYSCLENSMDRGAWQAIVHRVTFCWIQLSVCTHTSQLTGPRKQVTAQ